MFGFWKNFTIHFIYLLDEVVVAAAAGAAVAVVVVTVAAGAVVTVVATGAARGAETTLSTGLPATPQVSHGLSQAASHLLSTRGAAQTSPL